MYDKLNEAHLADYDRRRLNARKILNRFRDFAQPKSLIDVGCGAGQFLDVALNDFAMTVAGVDGEFETRFHHRDLEQYLTRIDLNSADALAGLSALGRFDACVCVEVAEHLADSVADRLVQSLTALSDYVVFSAAIPGQGGAGHINERWGQYWIEKFKSQGFQVYDIFKPAILADPEIFWWFKQNLMLLAREGLVDALPGFAQMVHPVVYKNMAKNAQFSRKYKQLMAAVAKNGKVVLKRPTEGQAGEPRAEVEFLQDGDKE